MATKKQQDPTDPAMQAVQGPPTRVTPEVYGQMARAAADFSKAGLGKDSVNQQQGFKFRGIDSLMDLASPILSRHHLLMLPAVRSRSVETRETRNGGLLYNVVLDVEFHFVSGLDGSSFPVRVIGEAMDSGDKATNKAMSAAYKYAMFQSFCIPLSGAMEEADETTPEETVAAKPPVPEGYQAIKDGAFDAAKVGTEALRDYVRGLGANGKQSPGWVAWDYLVKVDPNYGDLRTLAADSDKVRAAFIADDVKTTGSRVPGEDDV